MDFSSFESDCATATQRQKKPFSHQGGNRPSAQIKLPGLTRRKVHAPRIIIS